MAHKGEKDQRRIELGKLVDRLCARPAQDTTNLAVGAATIRNELGDALERHTVSIEHARRVVDELVYRQWRPGPAEIQAAAEELLSPAERAAQIIVKSDPACKECSGTGWKHVMRGGLSGVAKCDCWAQRPRGSEDPVLPPPTPAERTCKTEDKPKSVREIAEISDLGGPGR